MLKEPLLTSDVWMKFMKAGDFENAWKFSDKILESGINRDYYNVPRHFQQIWDGTPLNDKKVLIRCYHGLGDTIQFIRYVSLVKKITSDVIVWAQSSIIKLLSTVKGIDQLLPLHNGTPEIDYDTDVEIMELPHIFRTTISTIPLNIPYLYVDSIPISKDRKHLYVGLVWQAGEWDKERNIPFSLLMSLLEIEGVQFYILQENAAKAGWNKEFGIYPGEFDLFDYARMVKAMDLLITIDSMPAHLAGALNVRVWVMLKAEADWRWMKDRVDSPWYPSMRLFRQKVQGDWKSVVNEIMRELRSFNKKEEK